MAPGPSSSSIVIDLISSDDEAAPVVKSSLGKRKSVEPAASVELEDDDDDALCMEVEPPAQPALRDAAASAADADEEDVVFQGRTGDHALLDFPHSRENCAHVKFVLGKEAECCAHCYCFVCEYVRRTPTAPAHAVSSLTAHAFDLPYASAANLHPHAPSGLATTARPRTRARRGDRRATAAIQ